MNDTSPPLTRGRELPVREATPASAGPASAGPASAAPASVATAAPRATAAASASGAGRSPPPIHGPVAPRQGPTPPAPVLPPSKAAQPSARVAANLRATAPPIPASRAGVITYPSPARQAAMATPSPARAAGDGSRVRVMICDDSATIRAALARMLASDPALEVVARVADGRAALDELPRARPDIVILDIEMPVMDGMTALPLLLRADPALRVVMASTLTTRGADIAMRALRLGAADYIPKPGAAEIADDSFRRELLAKMHGLARLRRASARPNPAKAPASALRAASVYAPELIAIGSSTGGPQALFTLLQGLGREVRVPVVLTQHLPPAFTPTLADHLTRLGGLPCAEAVDGEALQPGRIYLAPGDRHLLVTGQRGKLAARLTSDPAENFCRPSVDPMLRSAATVLGGRILVVMLTGMGQDGLLGTRGIVEAGGAALAQDEATSIVWGMPGAIAQAGLCHRVLPLSALAPAILDLLRQGRT